MEAEGISKFWKIKLVTKRKMTKTVEMEARDSRGVSERCSAVSVVAASVSIVSVKTRLPEMQVSVYR